MTMTMTMKMTMMMTMTTKGGKEKQGHSCCEKGMATDGTLESDGESKDRVERSLVRMKRALLNLFLNMAVVVYYMKRFYLRRWTLCWTFTLWQVIGLKSVFASPSPGAEQYPL